MLRPNHWNEGLNLINKLLLYWLWVHWLMTHDSLTHLTHKTCVLRRVSWSIDTVVTKMDPQKSRWDTLWQIQLFWERLSEKVHATILKGIVGDFKCTVFQRNLKESYGRPLIYVCECWRKVTKVGSTATVVRNRVLIISHITFRDCRVHFILDKLSRNSCI